MQCSTAENPCSAQPQSIPAVPYRQASLQRRATMYPCSTQPQSILAMPTAKYPCSAQPPSISTVPNRRVSLQRQDPTRGEDPCVGPAQLLQDPLDPRHTKAPRRLLMDSQRPARTDPCHWTQTRVQKQCCWISAVLPALITNREKASIF